MRRIGVLAAALVAALVPARGAQAQACGHPARLATDDLTQPAAVLARALSSRRATADRSSGIFRTPVHDTQVCLDSVPFLSSWASDAEPPVISLAPIRARLIANSAYPRSVNDGALWAGKGVSAVLGAGIEARWRFLLGEEEHLVLLSAALRPSVAFQENADYPFATASRRGFSPFAHPDYPGIDLPKRLGVDPFSTFDMGASFVRADVGPLTAAFSTENLWLGPAQIYPLLLSSSAPGFPHLRVSTSRPLDLRVVNAEFQVFWGSVSESDYFDGKPDNDTHLFTGTSLVLEPRFLPGLYLGVSRVYHDIEPATGHSLGFYLGRLGEIPLYNRGGNRAGNAIGALYLRWVHPESGFEMYVEWSREDTPFDWMEVLREPDWTRAYAAGTQKVFLSPHRLIRVYGEMVHLGASAPTVRNVRGPFTTYTHSRQTHGHTHRGQILGAGIGPASDAQRIGVDVFTDGAMAGAWIERVRYDEDAYYNKFARHFGQAAHDVELTLGAQRVQPLGPVQVEVATTVSRRYNRDFLNLRQGKSEDLVEMNLGGEIGVRWLPRF